MAQNNSLQDFRNQIDDIDLQIIDLLQQRSGIVLAVKQLKESVKTQDYSLYIKPNREFEIIQKMSSIKSVYNENFFPNIWRTIISACNLIEQNLKIVSTSTKIQQNISAHFGNLIDIETLPMQEAIAQMLENKVNIIGFSSSNKQFYELLQQTNNIKIFALIKQKNMQDYIFLCGKMQNIAQYFNHNSNHNSYTVTTEPTQINIAKNVYLKRTNFEEKCLHSSFIFGYCFADLV